ncbi:MAG: helix-hairpin-helix domain-containing protein [Oceanicoccus sp.]
MRLFRYIFLSLCLLLSSPLFAADSSILSPVNINTADAATLSASLKGVGSSKAEAIVAYRDNYGPFKSVEELTAVKGIGDSLLAKNKGNISLK